ncbi:M20 aminoacylase family protein [Benzoatithermus flavus]|uniref:M20 aminoacylase family protein n=1 Tax=Benzoatithermus flavus TaxID=3108223 RepID=A0ABU8XTL9_9PROT
MPIINRIAEFQDEIAAWRRHLHARPELGFEEHATAAFVAGKLESFGVDEVHTGLARTGVVGVIRAGTSARRIGLRADMDALPIQEETGLPWASQVPGRMHACGHDGHTAMLLGAARYLAETRNFDGTVYLIFQPGEEGFGGGREMVKDGLFKRFPAEQIFGLHNWPYAPAGSFAMCKGPAMAASDEFTIEIVGRGCHAAMPHTGRDPVVAAALLVQALQPLVAREVDPLDNAVVSVTRIAGGHAYNIVPERVELWGTIRTFREETRAHLIRRVQEVAKGTALAQGLEAEVRILEGYPATINSPREAQLGADVAAEIAGEDRVERDPAPAMGSEDFAFMLKERPGSYIWMGTGTGTGDEPLHSPRYDFNDATLAYGVSYWARLVERLLPKAA